MLAFKAKVIYRFAVISADNIVCIPWFLVHVITGLFCLLRRQNSPEKVIQYLFKSSEKKVFLTSAGVLIFFPRNMYFNVLYCTVSEAK